MAYNRSISVTLIYLWPSGLFFTCWFHLVNSSDAVQMWKYVIWVLSRCRKTKAEEKRFLAAKISDSCNEEHLKEIRSQWGFMFVFFFFQLMFLFSVPFWNKGRRRLLNWKKIDRLLSKKKKKKKWSDVENWLRIASCVIITLFFCQRNWSSFIAYKHVIILHATIPRDVQTPATLQCCWIH